MFIFEFRVRILLFLFMSALFVMNWWFDTIKYMNMSFSRQKFLISLIHFFSGSFSGSGAVDVSLQEYFWVTAAFHPHDVTKVFEFLSLDSGYYVPVVV